MPESSPTIRDIARALEAWAPPGSAQSYDNVGLQVGDPRRTVERGLIALDLTPQVIDEAQRFGATLIVTHHPLIFRPLKSVTASGFVPGLALRLAEAGIALYSIHTNLDAAPGGVSFALAEQLGLQDVRFLERAAESLYKLATFVPAAHFETVRTALALAGAGRIGEYDACAFALDGRGFFRPGAAANPHIGTAGGRLETVEEVRLEVEVSRWDLGRVLDALKTAHPYEEVAYDVYPVLQTHTRVGLGAIGKLPVPQPLPAFLAHVADCLDVAALRYAGDPESSIDTVAVCGGAGSDFIRSAFAAGANAYVTADVTYHRFFEVLDETGHSRMALIDAGHYETEAVAERLLGAWLAARFPAVVWHPTETRTSPVHTFARPPVS